MYIVLDTEEQKIMFQSRHAERICLRVNHQNVITICLMYEKSEKNLFIYILGSIGMIGTSTTPGANLIKLFFICH